MSDKPERTQEERPAGPPVLQRAAPGGRPGVAPSAAPAPAPRTAQPTGGGFGLAPREVTAAAAIAAGLEADGALEKESPLHLYYLAAAAQASGRLILSEKKGSYALTFRKGTVEHVASTHPGDDVGRFLVARGLLRAEQLEKAEEAGGDPVATLVAQKLIDPARTYEALQEHASGLAWRALAGESGTWRWEPGAVPPPSSFPLGQRWAVLCDAARRLDGPTLKRRLGARSGRAAVKVGGRIQPTDLRLTPRETRVVSLFDGVRSVDDLCGAQPAEADLVRRVALLLVETELLTFGDERAAAPRVPAARPQPPPSPPRAAERAAPPKPAAAAAGAKPVAPKPPAPKAAPRPPAPARPAGPDVSLAGLQKTFDRMKNADHFAVLGVGREANAAQIKAAYFSLAKSYHPDSAPQDDPPQGRQLRADIFARVSEAWATLGEDEGRARYLEELRLGGAADVDVAAILKSEQSFQMAEILVKGRKYAEALKTLEEAIALNPDEPEYFVWKAWVEFLLAPAERKRAQQASSAQAIEAGLRKNPRCLPGYLFLGQMAKLVGDAASAERHLKRGLAIDETHADLLRELKYLKR